MGDPGGCHHGPAVSEGWCQLFTVPTRVSPVDGMAIPELLCSCSQLRTLCYNNCSLALPLPGQILHFEFPSLGMGAGVGTRPSFSSKGLRYSHHFRLSLCGHQVRTVWANTCAHMKIHPGSGYRHTGANIGTCLRGGHSGEWAHMGRRPWKHACRHRNTPGKAHKGTHRRAQEQACIYGKTWVHGWAVTGTQVKT